MKFANVVKGKRAEDRIEVPGFNDENGKPWVVLAVPITGIEYESACASARARAVEKGVPNPAIGDPIYDLALMAFVIAVGCVDPDSPENNRTPSFSSAVEILQDMHPETIVYIHERHELWQSECSPNVFTFTGGDEALNAAVSEVAGPDGRTTFMRWSPSMRLNFSLSTARLLKGHWDSLRLKSISGSDSASNESSDEETPKSHSNPNLLDEDSTKESPDSA
jgi:hypothetical protein